MNAPPTHVSPHARYRKQQLRLYEPTLDEINYMIASNIRTGQQRLNFMVQLKILQQLYYFPSPKDIPSSIANHIRQSLNITKRLKPHYHYSDTAARHRALIRQYLTINVDTKLRDKQITLIATAAAKAQNDPAEIINTVIETLVDQQYELPAFSTLDRIVSHIRHHINADIFIKTTNRLRNARKLLALMTTLD